MQQALVKLFHSHGRKQIFFRFKSCLKIIFCKSYQICWNIFSLIDTQTTLFIVCNPLHFQLIKNILPHMDHYAIYPASIEARNYLSTNKITFRKYLLFPRKIVATDFLEFNQVYFPGYSLFFQTLLLKTKCLKFQIYHGILDKNWTYEKKHNMAYQKLLVPGSYAKNRLQNVGISSSKISIVGFSKFSEHFLQLADEPYIHPGKPIILYAPTYGVISSLPHLLKQILELNKRYKVVVKPHYYDYQSRYIYFLKQHGIQIILDSEVEKYFLSSNIMISDSSSIAFEYLITKKPVIVLDNLLWIEGLETLHSRSGPEYLMRSVFYRSSTPTEVTKLVAQLIHMDTHHSKVKQYSRIADQLFSNIRDPGKTIANVLNHVSN